MLKPIIHYKTNNNNDGFEIRHLIKPGYFNTVEELNIAHKELLDWLMENCANEYKILAMDNAAFSDINENPWVGYHLTIHNSELAMAFKLRWM